MDSSFSMDKARIHYQTRESIGEVQYLRVTFARIRRKLEQCGLDGGVIAAYSSVGYLITEPD